MNPLITTVQAWDTETFRIKPGNQTPPMVCSQWATATRSALGWTLGRAQVVLADEGLWNLVQWLADPTVLIVGAEISFDVLASVFTVDTTEREAARAIGLDPEQPGLDLLTRWVSAYDNDRVTDVLVREKLIDLARGCYRYERHNGTVTGVNKYNLAAIAKKRAGIEIPEEHKRCSLCDNTGCPACPWRVRYGELHRVPVAQWLPEPRQYAETDGLATGGSWIGQWRHSEEIAANYPETGGDPAWALREEFEESRNSLWLKAMSAYGLRTDPKAVATFAEHVEREYTATAQELVEAGLLKRAYKRDMKAIRSFIERKGLLEYFTKTSPNEPPAFSLARRCYDSGIASADPETSALLWLLREGQYEHAALLEAKLTEVHESKDTKAAEAAVIAAWPDAPLSPACKCKNKGTAYACKPDHKTKNGTCPAGKKKLDKDTLELAASLIESRADTGAIAREWADEQAHVLRLYGELGHLSKQLSTDIPVLLRGSYEPIHTRFESILETMRTSSSGPNVQNQARGGESKCEHCDGSGCTQHKKCEKLWAQGCVKCSECKGRGKVERPGARECFVPRAGWVLLDCFAPGTKILKSDLTWAAVETLAPGEELIGFDEQLNGRDNKFRPSIVEAVQRSRHTCYRIETDRGEITVSDSHMFVARRGVMHYRGANTRHWLRADALEAGDTISFLVEPWEQENTLERAYLCGFFDGEGWVSQASVGVGQNPGPVLDYVLGLLRARGFNFAGPGKAKCEHWYTVGGTGEALKVLGILRPLRLLPKARAIWDGAQTWGKRSRPAVISKITCIGEQETISVKTSTSTLIAEGFLSHNCDYGMLELHTLAQSCYWMLGHSTLGDALRQGKDPHTIVASQILGITYDACLAALANEHDPLHKAAKNARNCGKAVNFGRPGGLSARTMRSYAVKSYGVSKTELEWKAIIETWNQTWVEMPEFFAVIGRFESYPRSGWFNISYPGLPGYRAGANYCSGCNTMYQRLGAKVAKLAGWYAFKGSYVDTSSPLFGSRPVLFVHDQFIVETREDGREHEAAIELARLMNLASAQLLPDVPSKTEPVIARRWSKNAKEVTADGTKLKEGGRLIAWEDSRLT